MFLKKYEVFICDILEIILGEGSIIVLGGNKYVFCFLVISIRKFIIKKIFYLFY